MGMTLAEVIVAMAILTGVVLSLGAFMAKFSQASGQAHLLINANEIAAQQLDAVRTQPSYSAITLLAGSSSVKTDVTTFTVKTVVDRVGGSPTDTVDYKLVSVTVTAPSMRKKVTKTTAVAAY
jgi:type II secretory pathway pseudopilin PulG